jgi:uncharacterized membrane protein
MTVRQSTLLVLPDMNYFLRDLVCRFRAGCRPNPGSNSISDWLLVAAIGVVLLAALPVHAAGLCTIGIADYACTILNFSGASSTRATGMNNAGQITGFYELTGTHAFTYSGSTFTALPDPSGASAVYAFDVNDNGQVAGYTLSSVGYRGFVRNGTTYTSLAVGGAQNTYAFGIDATGQVVVGASEDASGRATGYRFSFSSGTFDSISMPGAVSTYAYGLNNSGTIAGTYADGSAKAHGFTLSGGAYATVDVPGAQQTYVLGLNNLGDLVGKYVDSLSGTRGFVRLESGNFWTFDIAGAGGTFATAINDSRLIAGYFQTGSTYQGFVAMPTPIPLPATLPLLAAGLLTVLRRCRIRPA